MSSWNMAFRNLKRRRVRTVLTVSGIIVGVSMILVLLSLAAGTSNQANRLIQALGGADITVVNGTTTEGPGGFFRSSGTINQSLTQTIAGIQGVYAVSPELSFGGYVNGQPAFVNGIDPATYSTVTSGLNIVTGDTLSQNAGSQVVLGRRLADTVAISVGNNVTVGTASSSGESFSVVGIFETGLGFQDNGAYIPLRDAQNINNQQGSVSRILVKAQDPNQVTAISNSITSSVTGVRVISAATFAANAANLRNTLTSFFTIIGLVALLAGGFGVANTMVMSVTERTREVGTLKAIGARNSEILKIFLSEAFLIGLIGGIVGVTVGVVASLLLPAFTGSFPGGGGGPGGFFRAALFPALTPYNVLLSFFLGTVVGVMGGLYPAWRASGMRPVEALRHV